jgi:N-6 DNA Methylase/Eco57I restriction-modification methylase
MIPGLGGTLLSEDALEHVVPDALRGLLDESGRAAARRHLSAWHAPLRKVLGPASGSRTLFDRLAVPLFSQLGYRVVADGAHAHVLRAVLEVKGQSAATLFVTGWGQDPASSWRDVVLHGISHGLRWCFCLNGPSLRVVDGLRTYSRQFVELDLDTALDQEKTFAVLWGVLRADAMCTSDDDGRPVLERAIEISERHRAAVRSSLQLGVNDALQHLLKAFSIVAASGRRRGKRQQTTEPHKEALIIIYRILFLLFAEARGLVPAWHPVYRDGYTIEALRQPIETLPRPRGVWETLQSITRLAHRGCHIGALHVTPFNGRLFSPTESPLADSAALDDGAVRHALLALTTRPGRSGRERISYGDLGVEQLGGVYERLLDLERKTTGSFYTPRSLTEFVVRRTLAPLVENATPDGILSLRILDPAMGSGAFLVAACRYLAHAYEAALVREQDLRTDDITDGDRADFRRMVAQRCLYGVDVNAMAVQLGRLSLWLATLSADRPLTFLDHRLRAGNSLVGASPLDLARQSPGRAHRARPTSLPLFDDEQTVKALRTAIIIRQSIASEPGDTLAQVRAKEHALTELEQCKSPLSQWKSACDLWCAAWFLDRDDDVSRPFGALMDTIFERGTLPEHIAAPRLDAARAAAYAHGFFHWTLEFPEIFDDQDGRGGFDAVIGNPPWEMLRGDTGNNTARASSKAAASRLTAFARGSGIYACQGNGHANLYQLFLERMMSLVRRGGRLGVILPSGLAIDHGATGLRRALLARTRIDTLVSFENRDGVFPIHRGLKFLLLSASIGAQTTVIPCRFGLRRPEALDELPEGGPDPASVVVPRALVERLDPNECAMPDVRTTDDVDLLTRIAFTIPALGDPDGWNVRFGRELNATDDRRHFHRASSDSTGLPVVEGKHIAPFTVDLASTEQRIAAHTAATLVDPDRTFRRTRLAYRDVASPTNRLTLIAALVPRGTVTTHTLFCLKDPLEEDSQYYLCAMFNSFVANYLVRLRVGTHVTTAIIDRVPVPRPRRDSVEFKEVVHLTSQMMTAPAAHVCARLQAVTAKLYGLEQQQFRHIVDTFPLVANADRHSAIAAFCDIVT